MSLDGKPFDQLTHEDILALIPDVAEGRRLDYKKALPDNTEKGVRSFLNDVCALGNSAGGWLIYGVDEEREDESKTGVPSEVCGVGEVNEDEAIRDWQQRITQAVEPRLIGHRVGFINGFEDGKKVMVVYVPKSLFAPHRTNYKGVKEFYVRHDRNNLPMDIGEIRHSFVEAKEVPQRIDEFRRLRAMQILAGETPIELLDVGAVFTCHVIPLSSFSDEAAIDVTAIERTTMPTHGGHTSYGRLNADGYLYHSPVDNDSYRGYVQVFRAGVIELCDSATDQPRPDQFGVLTLSAQWLEKWFIEFVSSALALLSDSGVQPPVYIGIGLMRVKGASMPREDRIWHRGVDTIDKDILLVPTVTSETMSEDAGRLLRPALDAIWQASGIARCPNYNDEGNWSGR